MSKVTGSTVQVYLEYIQRNLPEGVAMEVTKVSPKSLKFMGHVFKPYIHAQ